MNLSEAFRILNEIITRVQNYYITPEQAAEEAKNLKQRAVNAGLMSFNPPTTEEDFKSLQENQTYETSEYSSY